MPSPSEKSVKAVHAIWDKVAQPGPDGNKQICFVNRNDLVYLFCTGFVDESRHTLHDWVDSFKDSLQEDGSYKVNEAQWMDKARFRHSGPVGQPFDPMQLRDGAWTEQEMEAMIKTHLLPAVYFSEKELRAIWNEAKDTFYLKGSYHVTPEVKKDLRMMIDMYPSPGQVRALGLAEARAQMGISKGGAVGSRYASGPAQSQVAAQRLADLLGNIAGKK